MKSRIWLITATDHDGTEIAWAEQAYSARGALTQLTEKMSERQPVAVIDPAVAVGEPFPGRPGYFTGFCGHAVAGSEWRAGFRTCEHCTLQERMDDQ